MMSHMITYLRLRLRQAVREERGATMVEYGLIAALIALAAITVLSGLGENIVEKLRTISEDIGNADKK